MTLDTLVFQVPRYIRWCDVLSVAMVMYPSTVPAGCPLAVRYMLTAVVRLGLYLKPYNYIYLTPPAHATSCTGRQLSHELTYVRMYISLSPPLSPSLPLGLLIDQSMSLCIRYNLCPAVADLKHMYRWMCFGNMVRVSPGWLVNWGWRCHWSNKNHFDTSECVWASLRLLAGMSDTVLV